MRCRGLARSIDGHPFRHVTVNCVMSIDNKFNPSKGKSDFKCMMMMMMVIKINTTECSELVK